MYEQEQSFTRLGRVEEIEFKCNSMNNCTGLACWSSSTENQLVTGVSEKSDEFITCIFRVVLEIKRRMGYQVKDYSKIFCLSGNSLLGVTVLGSARAFSWVLFYRYPRRPVQRRGPLPLGLQSDQSKLETLVTWEVRCGSRGTILLSQEQNLVHEQLGRHTSSTNVTLVTPKPSTTNAVGRC